MNKLLHPHPKLKCAMSCIFALLSSGFFFSLLALLYPIAVNLLILPTAFIFHLLVIEWNNNAVRWIFILKLLGMFIASLLSTIASFCLLLFPSIPFFVCIAFTLIAHIALLAYYRHDKRLLVIIGVAIIVSPFVYAIIEEFFTVESKMMGPGPLILHFAILTIITLYYIISDTKRALQL